MLRIRGWYINYFRNNTPFHNNRLQEPIKFQENASQILLTTQVMTAENILILDGAQLPEAMAKNGIMKAGALLKIMKFVPLFVDKLTAKQY